MNQQLILLKTPRKTHARLKKFDLKTNKSATNSTPTMSTTSSIAEILSKKKASMKLKSTTVINDKEKRQVRIKTEIHYCLMLKKLINDY